MSQVVLDAIAADVALLERVVEVPEGSLGYGTDLSLADDLTEKMEEVDPFSPLGIAQSIVRRLDCPRGGLPDASSPTLVAEDYGIELAAYLNQGTTTIELRALASNIRNEVTKDDRVDSVVVVVTPSNDGSSLAIDIQVTPFDARLGTFSLTLAVTSAGVLLEEIRNG